MMLQPRPKGISLNKNAINIQANQQQQQPLRTPSPPQLKSHAINSNTKRPKAENDEPILKKPLQLLSQQPQLQQLQPQPVAQLIQLHDVKQQHQSKIPRLREAKQQIEEIVEDIDKTDSRDAIFLVCDIAKDIYSYMYDLENQQSVQEDYLKDQKILTPRVRQRLVNWCIDLVLYKLKLYPETLYLTISIIDRYFNKVTVKQQNQVQLIACGAILVASKYEEIYPPEINDLVLSTQNAYSRRDIMRTEIEILQTLNYDLGRPIPLAFLRRFSKAAHCDLKMHSIAKFLMELSLTEYECCHWNPSLLAATALFISKYLVNPNGRSSAQEIWDKTLTHYSRYSLEDLREPAATLGKIVKKSLKSPLSSTTVKRNALNISKWTELKSPRLDDLIM